MRITHEILWLIGLVQHLMTTDLQAFGLYINYSNILCTSKN